MTWAEGRVMVSAPRDGSPILIVNAHGECNVVYWSSDDYFGEPFGWTADGGNRFDPVKWWPLPAKAKRKAKKGVVR